MFCEDGETLKFDVINDGLGLIDGSKPLSDQAFIEKVTFMI